jgi:hypothetical protein
MNGKGRGGDAGDLVRCAACDDHIKISEGFTCPRCKKGLLCKKHRLSRHRECLSCTFDLKLREVNTLRDQEKNIKSFIRFAQFLFMVFAVFFTATKLGFTNEIEFLQNHFITDSLLYMGIGAVILWGIFYVVLFSQRGRIASVENAMRDIEFRR